MRKSLTSDVHSFLQNTGQFTLEITDCYSRISTRFSKKREVRKSANSMGDKHHS
uniref:Uncharacterized protein n=1 Tax=Anguilla anguilla TaxID=7936 RepID=A0A0E9VM30_ANGAN